MNNHQIEKFVAAHVGRSASSNGSKKAKANKTAAPTRPALGVGPTFPAIAQPSMPKPAKGAKGPTGTSKKGASKKSNGTTQHIHIHIKSY